MILSPPLRAGADERIASDAALPRIRYTLIVPTKDRGYHLGRRMPVWALQGFDEIIVVDSSRNRIDRAANEELCRRFGATYVHAPVNRSRARNMGARMATAGWLFFADDDLWGYATFHRDVMDRYAFDHDWLKAPDSQVIHIFNREFFLRLGGYKENLVLGEDDDLAMRARTRGTGGPVDGLFEGLGFEPNDHERSLDFPRRLSNYIEYSLTLWEYVPEAENPAQQALGWCFSLLRLGRSVARGELQAIPYLLGACGGLFFGLVAKLVRSKARRRAATGAALNSESQYEVRDL